MAVTVVKLSDMTKKRKAGSPSQEGQSDINLGDLKEFIMMENAKNVKDIKESNERRLAAVEDSLSFTMDALTSVSARQQSADQDILMLQKEVAELRCRLRRMELEEDRRQQDGRMQHLIFSGPVIQSLRPQEDPFERIRSVLSEYVGRDVHRDQIKSIIKLKNGKVGVEFPSASRGSERDVLFRSKTRLRGSGLFISEFLTPRRQDIFLALLALKKRKVIFSVFTRSGDVMVCRTRDSAPFKVMDIEAVAALTPAGSPRGADQGRAQEMDGGGAPLGTAAGGEEQRRPGMGAGASPPTLCRGREEQGREGALTAGRGGRPRPDVATRPCGSGDSNIAESPAHAESSRHPSSLLLDCAGESVRLVHLSPRLGEEPELRPAPMRVTTDGSPGSSRSLRESSVRGCPVVPGSRVSAPPGAGPAGAGPAGTGTLESPLDSGTSRPASAPLAGRGVSGEESGRGSCSALPPGGQRQHLSSSQPAADDTRGELRQSRYARGVVSETIEREEGDESSDGRISRETLTRTGKVEGARPRPFPSGPGRSERDFSRSRDIRDYF